MVITPAAGEGWRASGRADSTMENTTTMAPAKVVVDSKIIGRFLGAALVLLATADFAMQTLDATLSPTIPGWVQMMKLVDLDRESSLPTWYSIIILGLSSILLGLIGWTARRSGDRMWSYWAILSMIFVGLSVDEQVRGHESLGEFIGDAIDVGGLFFFAWVIPGAIFTGILGLMFLPFLRELPPRTRKLFILAGCLYVGGALGMETLAGVAASRDGMDNLLFATMSSIEETLEISGISCFILALIGEARRRKIAVSITFDNHRQPDPLL